MVHHYIMHQYILRTIKWCVINKIHHYILRTIKKVPEGIYSKDPFGDLRAAMKTLHVDCSPADWQRFEELERESAYRDFTIEDAANIKGPPAHFEKNSAPLNGAPIHSAPLNGAL